MRPNLDTLAEEINQHLASEHFIVFRSLGRGSEKAEVVFWDTQQEPEFRRFLECAVSLGIRLIHLNTRIFRTHHREEALEMLEALDLPREDKRDLERRIKGLSIYEGFTCAIELSFNFEDRLYLFELQSEWFEEWQDILDELEDSSIDEESEDDSGFGGFYSNN